MADDVIPNGPLIGALPFLLPYLEQEPLWEILNTGLPPGYFSSPPAPSTAPWWAYPGPWAAGNNVVPIFLCPSNYAQAAPDQTAALMSYYSSTTLGYTLELWYFPFNTQLGPTNYLGVAGFMGQAQDPIWVYPGVFGDDTRISLTRVSSQDGTSNTLMFGESVGGPNNSPTPTYAPTWMGSGALPTYMGLTPPGDWYNFSSMHDGVVNFARCDGSVVAISTGGDVAAQVPNNFQAACSYNDGVNVNWAALGVE